MGNNMNQITKAQHYIPRFILNNFVGKDKEFRIIYKERGNIMHKAPKSVCFVDYLYETENVDGTYYKINEIENKFAEDEDRISKEISKMLIKLNGLKPLDKGDIENLAFAVALQLVRMPVIKQLIIPNIDIEGEDTQTDQRAIYRSILICLDDGIQYREKNGNHLSDVAYNKLFELTNGESFIEYLKKSIIENCFVYLARADYAEFCLSDNPVIIYGFDNIRYLYPFSPQYAIVCESKDDNREIPLSFLMAFEEKDVKLINQRSISQTDKFLIFRDEYKENIIDEIKSVIKEGDIAWHINF